MARKKVGNSHAARSDPFAAIPVIAGSVEVGRNDDGTLRLRWEVDPGRGLWGRLAQQFRFKKFRQFNLDAEGSFFWGLIDGRRDLRQIAVQISREFDLKEQEGRDITVVFVKQLMLRHLIALRLPGMEAHAPGTPPEGQEDCGASAEEQP